MLAAGFKVSIRWGNLSTLRLMLSFMAHPALFFGLKVETVQPPGCEPCYWLSLKSHNSNSSSTHGSSKDPNKPDIVLCYVHGGAFVAGHPLMCASTFERWMKALARQGLNTKVLCIQYPLAPERPFPAAVASTAAVFAWVGQVFPAWSGTTVIALGDSAGGNITPAALHALRDYCQHRHPQVAGMGPAQRQQSQPAPGSITAALQATVAESSSSNGNSLAEQPAGETEHAAAAGSHAGPTTATAHMPSSLIRTDSQAAALTAALEAHLFADLHNRLMVMTAKSSSSSSDSTGALTVCRNVRMPSAVILVSPAADISPTASFRTRKLGPSTAAESSSSVPANTSSTATTPAGAAAEEITAAAGDGSSGSSSNGRRIHYDYLPENIESGGMGSYAEHHEQLCGMYASPVHLPHVDGLCTGRWLVLSGGVELLHRDIERWVAWSAPGLRICLLCRHWLVLVPCVHMFYACLRTDHVMGHLQQSSVGQRSIPGGKRAYLAGLYCTLAATSPCIITLTQLANLTNSSCVHVCACRFARKLQQALGPDRVMFHVEPKLPHSWAILPNPSMAARQEVVVRFIAAEHAAAVAAAEKPASMPVMVAA